MDRQEAEALTKRCLIAGFGDLGQRLAKRLMAAQGWQLWGLKRRPVAVPEGVELLLGDLLAGPLPELPQVDVLVYVVTPGERTEAAYKAIYVDALGRLLGLLAKHQRLPKRLIFVSSTSVYGQHQHEWVDETAAVNPSGFSGQQLLAAEQLALSMLPATIVRFSGIYGPGRFGLLNSVANGLKIEEPPVIWTNRIHAEDCAAVLAWLCQRSLGDQALQSLYLASDPNPARLQEVVDWLREQLAVQSISEQQSRLHRSSKRCRPSALLQAGFNFTYADFKAGYLPLLADFKARLQE